MILPYQKSFAALFIVRVVGNFSIYGIRSFLILYFTSVFIFSDEKSFNTYGTFMALLYLTPLFGGWLSDQFIGPKNAIITGGILAFLGSVILSLNQENLINMGISLLILGFGIIKPTNISTVGELFEDPQKKDRAYVILFVGMNIGNILGPLFCGFIGHYYGWHHVFLPIGLLTLGSCFFCYHSLNMEEKNIIRLKNIMKYFSLIMFVGCIVYICLSYVDYIDWFLPIIIFLGFCCFGALYQKSRDSDRRNLMSIFTLMTIFSCFCAVFEQTGGSINLFIDRYIDKNVMGFTVPTEFFQSINPLLVIIFSSFIKPFQKKQNVYDSFLIGFIYMGLSFLILGGTSLFTIENNLSALWILCFFAFQVIGELYIVPIGFSAVSKLSPKNHKSFVMGMWLVSIACGHYIASLFARLYAHHDGLKTISSYQSFFTSISLMPISIIIIMLIFRHKKTLRNLRVS